VVTSVAWSPDGTRLATTSNDATVRLWNPTTGHTTATLTGHTDRVTAVAWSPDGTPPGHGQRIAVRGLGGLTMLRWNTQVEHSVS
jgi:WD40 repeat protein